MERKPADGKIRNTERSKKKFLTAVEKIIKTKGYVGLKINDIAKVAGVDKKMIYTYFGGLDGLIDTYIKSQDFWSNINTEVINEPIHDNGKALIKGLFLAQYDFLASNKQLQKVLLWSLSDERKELKKLIDNQEQIGEVLLTNIFDPHFGEDAEKFRAVSAIMVAGLYYLNMFPEHNGSVFCGIDLNTESGRSAIKNAVSYIVDKTYD